MLQLNFTNIDNLLKGPWLAIATEINKHHSNTAWLFRGGFYEKVSVYIHNITFLILSIDRTYSYNSRIISSVI